MAHLECCCSADEFMRELGLVLGVVRVLVILRRRSTKSSCLRDDDTNLAAGLSLVRVVTEESHIV